MFDGSKGSSTLRLRVPTSANADCRGKSSLGILLKYYPMCYSVSQELPERSLHPVPCRGFFSGQNSFIYIHLVKDKGHCKPALPLQFHTGAFGYSQPTPVPEWPYLCHRWWTENQGETQILLSQSNHNRSHDRFFPFESWRWDSWPQWSGRMCPQQHQPFQ